jgi:hypothetical protein
VTIAIDLFIVWYLLVIVFGDRSPRHPVRRLLRPFDALVDGLGLRQHWAMFAPDPTSRSIRLHALIRLASGAAIRWDPPRFDRSPMRALRGFRRRLFELMIAMPGGAIARRSLAAYLVRTYGRGETPVEVVFVRTESAVPAPWDFSLAPSVERVVARIPIATADDSDAHHR